MDEDRLGVEGVFGPFLGGNPSSTTRGFEGSSMKRVEEGRGPAFGLRVLKWEKRECGSIVDLVNLLSGPGAISSQKMDDISLSSAR